MSKVKPFGTYVLVEMEEVEEISSGGIVIATNDGKKREQEGQHVGVIRGFGPLCYIGLNGINDNSETVERAEQWGVKIGDRVEFDRYAGKRLDHPGYELYRLIEDRMIMAGVEE